MSLASGAVLRARYEVVTPCFCSGADQRTAEVRLPSIKGVLRFWWRALAWSTYGGEPSRIQEEEAALFGSAGTGQSLVLLRLRSAAPPDTLDAGKILPGPGPKARTVGEGARYLGYGLMQPFSTTSNEKQAGKLERGCLLPPFNINLELYCRRAVSDTQADLLRRALIALGIFGGMGSRSRNGYGSLNLRELTFDDQPMWRAPTSAAALCEAIDEVVSPSSVDRLPPYSTFTADTRWLLLTGRQEPLQLLDDLGSALKGWMTPDTESLQRDNRSRSQETGLHRAPFGLPRHYGGGQIKPHRSGPGPTASDRRAGPLFLHIHTFPESDPVAVLTFLPTKFLPDGERIALGAKKVVPVPAEAGLYRPVHDFLDHLEKGRISSLYPIARGQK